jgi:hypothetical protein
MEIERSSLTTGVAVAILLAAAPGRAADGRGGDSGGRFCSATAAALRRACGFEVQDELAKAGAVCINVSDAAERAGCYVEARSAAAEGEQRCRRQYQGRLDACGRRGEGRYDPAFDPADFDDPRHPTRPNPFFPLKAGYRWEYRGGDEVNTVEVLDETKLIDGVTCLVVDDVVVRSGDLVEHTEDWFAVARDGNVWYCGEEVKDFESFDGDDPPRPELVSIDGSFKAGREGDRPGIIFRASPTAGESYLEEFSLGNAEDVTDVLSTDYRFGATAELDRFVPRRLAELLCAANCVVTKNYSLLEPGVSARKYYARGVGFFLEVDPDTGEVTRLVGGNVDPRCASLPTP